MHDRAEELAEKFDILLEEGLSANERDKIVVLLRAALAAERAEGLDLLEIIAKELEALGKIATGLGITPPEPDSKIIAETFDRAANHLRRYAAAARQEKKDD